MAESFNIESLLHTIYKALQTLNETLRIKTQQHELCCCCHERGQMVGLMSVEM